MRICEHGVSMVAFCAECVGFNPITATPACDWCGEDSCHFCVRQAPRIERVRDLIEQNIIYVNPKEWTP